jgi:hypothetical protein
MRASDPSDDMVDPRTPAGRLILRIASGIQDLDDIAVACEEYEESIRADERQRCAERLARDIPTRDEDVWASYLEPLQAESKTEERR